MLRSGIALALLTLAATGGGLGAQHEHHDAAAGPASPLGLSPTRFGSGTSWVPDATRMRARHAALLGWSVMLHGALNVQYVRNTGVRRRAAAGSTGHIMAVAARPVGAGVLRLRTHLSAEPLTLEGSGYPLLLQVAQQYQGDVVVDRQHPHELVGELALSVEHPVTAGLAAGLYVAARGEPAVGPVTWFHRPSALNDPLVPLGHAAQDVTHTSVGVVTAGVFTRCAKLEFSAFDGTHPDDHRTDLELGRARLDSWSGRLTVNLGVGWSMSASAARIAPSRGGAHAHGLTRRLSVSALHTRPLGSRGEWASAVVYGANVAEGGRTRGALLAETNFDLDGRNAVFGRAEYVTRTPEELALTGSISGDLRIAALSLGYARELVTFAGLSAGLGLRGTIHFVPGALDTFYGSEPPLGLLIHARVRPS